MTTTRRRTGRTPQTDWEEVFYEFAALPAPERSQVELAKRLGVSYRAVESAARRYGWAKRLQIIDRKAREQREQRAVRRLADRLEDNLRIVDAGRLKYAQRLRDPSYQMSGQEFLALAKLELLIEGRDTQKIGIGSISEEFRESLRQLPVYTQERILAAALTGVPYHEVLEIDAELVTEDDEGPSD